MNNFPLPDRLRKNRWRKIAILTAMFFAAVAYLLLFGMKNSMVYYLTLDEFYKTPPRAGDGIRLAGWVKEGTVAVLPREGGISFVMTDGERELKVRYHGQVPDSFRNQAEVIVEGIFRPQPVFEASLILPRCPSKYQASGPVAERKSGR